MHFLKRQLPVLIAFLFGMALWAQFFIPHSLSQKALQEYTGSWVVIIAGAALILGVMSAVHYHSSKIRLRKPGFGYSYITLIAFAVMAFMGLVGSHPTFRGGFHWETNRWPGFSVEDPLFNEGMEVTAVDAETASVEVADGVEWRGRSSLYFYGTDGAYQQFPIRDVDGDIITLYVPEGAEEAVLTGLEPGVLLFAKNTTAVAIGDNSPYMWMFHFVLFPLDATMFALLAFFIASAAFRAFRARSPEATALLVAAIILMIGRVPIGEMIPVFPPVGDRTEAFTLLDVSQFIFNWPNSAAQRGILLGVVLSQVAISLRIIFGIERTYMGGGED